MNIYKNGKYKSVHILDEQGELIAKIDNNPEFIEICKQYHWEADENGHVISRSPNDFGTETIYLAQLVLNFYRGFSMYPQVKMA